MFQPAITAPATRDNARYVVFYGDQLLLDFTSAEPCLQQADGLRFLGPPVARQLFLGYWQGEPCFAAELDSSEALLDNHTQRGSLYHLLGRVPDPLFALAGQAQQLLTWARRNQYCGQCGAPNDQHPVERAKVCEPCNVREYPRISPCVIALVYRGDELLLARNANFPGELFSTLAGFIEVGESVEDCLRREIREEVGVEIGEITYFGSQPWPFPDQLMLGFFAEYAGGDIVCEDEEIAEAHWFRPDALPTVPPPHSIAGQLIQAHVERVSSAAPLR
jgi:NAD+ diphosphatase